MKGKTITSCILVGLIFSNILVLAQAEDNNADEILAKMKTQLNLTDTQVNDVTPIIKEYAGRRQALMQIPETVFSPSKSRIRSQVEQLREEENKKLRQVLTPDQMKKWDHSENVKGFLNQDETEGADRTPSLNGMSF
jgi:hypothetical protein